MKSLSLHRVEKFVRVAGFISFVVKGFDRQWLQRQQWSELQDFVLHDYFIQVCVLFKLGTDPPIRNQFNPILGLFVNIVGIPKRHKETGFNGLSFNDCFFGNHYGFRMQNFEFIVDYYEKGLVQNMPIAGPFPFWGYCEKALQNR